MTPQLLITYIIGFLAVAAGTWAEYTRVLMMMQQNSYRPERYMRWLRSSGDTTSYPRIAGFLVLFGAMAAFTIPVWGMILMALFGSGLAITLLRRKYKKPLVWTPRVRRILAVMLVISALVVAGAWIWGYLAHSHDTALYYASVAFTGLYCASNMVVMAAVWLLKPVESRINRRFYDEAAEILGSMPALKVIGITGSYGKTSTKHYLTRILAEHFEVLMTPGSYNTTLGVIRTVREMMKPYTEVFVCEMGAKQPGDIKEICDLVHPETGIVTAVGPQHLESFKTIENVQRTKFELVDALPNDGLAVVNDDFPMVASRKVTNCRCDRYGVTNTKAPYRGVDITYGVNGTDFTLIGPDGLNMRLHTRLVGECNVSNLIAAVIVAKSLGVPDDKIRRAVERIEPVEHRLSMKRTPMGITIIDDAFNSNPSGSAMALDVLKAFTSGKRIIITPGMIELGDRQYELNREFGARIAASADVAIVVGEYNHDAIIGGIESIGNKELKIIEVPSFAVAQQHLSGFVAAGDTVLYENDLPDTFK